MPETNITDVKNPLPWERAEIHVQEAKRKAAQQFVNIWKTNKDRQDEQLRWGEEIEYMLVDLTDGDARAALCADKVLRLLGHERGGGNPAQGAGWRTEYGNMMIEGVTNPPFTWALEDILLIEPALAWRRQEIENVVKEVDPCVQVVSLASFPLLGVPGAVAPSAEPAPDGFISQSVLCPDEATSPHPRYQTFTANYRKRKGCKVGAFIPKQGIPKEQRLTQRQIATLPFQLAQQGSRARDPVEGHIYMDSQAFGACQCCTQATFLCHNLEEARYLTDQFLVLSPLFLALTAATPFLRGLVADTDTRWQTFQQCWDDRTERELESVRNSRTSPCDLFIGEKFVENAVAEKTVNNVDLAVHDPALQQLAEAGVDSLLSRHVAHLLVRDPLMLVENSMGIDDKSSADHWEQLQGTNWGSVRFKPPPIDGSIGWRVEFRMPEVQMTDFENAAIVAIIRVLAQIIVEQKWDLVIPVSLCDENDVASCERNAAVHGRFWFRDSVLGMGQVTQRSLADILVGEKGIFTLCRQWIEAKCVSGECSVDVRNKLFSYITLFEKRASGELPTTATFLRSRLAKHPAYESNGVLPVPFVHDLCKFASTVNKLRELPVELVGEIAGSTKRARCD